MRKITFLLFIAALPLVSCSSSDDKDQVGRHIKATIDGTAYTFNTLTVSTDEYTEGDFTYTDVTMTGSVNNDPAKTVSIVVMEGATGNDASWYFGHHHDGEEFLKDDSFSTIISENAGRRIKGTFSGNVVSNEDGEIKTITNGSFEVTY
ncbi:MAG: hypothetical protein EOO50_04825 [Flavobacterium sp.]|uniref:hypothetical protein n=1 Tax=Flavobacterium sp. TaxID=239 RepID=UPI0012025970|nr:hypothetical protein [Flavobacterium sp.]RZJ67606.1 MAG: hypothetical protein EOO50_04825 [Flavobacterium sp.]